LSLSEKREGREGDSRKGRTNEQRAAGSFTQKKKKKKVKPGETRIKWKKAAKKKKRKKGTVGSPKTFRSHAKKSLRRGMKF